ncbi:MAG: hypothetical protein DHS20C08_15740 [Rhodomicrobium sp.]|nr:MAG: hypothetical protein DHS20C08_15740 [Rhodomicrobium sp.]
MKLIDIGQVIPFFKRCDDQLLTLWFGISLSSLCLVFFTFDVAGDYFFTGDVMDSTWHLALELLVVLVAIAAFLVHLKGLIRLVSYHNKVSAQVRIASGEFAFVLEELFRDWKLTAAEKDVAMLIIKGVSFKDIAASRHSREGTAKAQANAIYRKAGVTGRNELVALLLDEFINDASAA